MQQYINIDNLTKKFGNQVAVNAISLSLSKGEVLGFLGPNGAGKTTSMRMITGFLRPTSGKIKICGYDLEENEIEVKSLIGYMPEGAPLYQEMTPYQYLNFICDARGLSGSIARNRLEFVISKLNLRSVLKKQIYTLSKGYKARVSLAQAIIHDPKILILDEPTDGLDPIQKHEVRDLIAEISKDKAIILSTHILDEVETTCTRTLIIAKGKIVLDGTPKLLKEKSRYYNAVFFRTNNSDFKLIRNDLNKIPNVEDIEVIEHSDHMEITVFPMSGESILNDMSKLLARYKLDYVNLYVSKGKLDEIFRRVVE
jgi:ABC-2 type transport system ATP-binding protein